MSQIMEMEQKNSLIHDFITTSSKYSMHSSANPAKCVICGKGLGDGFSITAKSVFNETQFFCDVHLNY